LSRLCGYNYGKGTTMLTICAGIFLRITKTTNEDVPVGALLVLALVCDLLLFTVIVTTIITGLPTRV
jgi:hypothetical protein